jgi:hypothetical protein
MSGSTITITCWGCHKSETHPMLHGEEGEKQMEELADRGWMRRSFGPSSWDKGPWFCSQECAHESYNAKQAEAYWENKDEEDRQREFARYCRETQLPKIYFAIFGVFIALIMGLFWRVL